MKSLVSPLLVLPGNCGMTFLKELCGVCSDFRHGGNLLSDFVVRSGNDDACALPPLGGILVGKKIQQGDVSSGYCVNGPVRAV